MKSVGPFFDPQRWSTELDSAAKQGNTALRAFVAKLDQVDAPLDVKLPLIARAFLSLSEGPGLLAPLDPKWKDETAKRFTDALRLATEAPALIAAAKTPDEVLASWPIRSQRPDVLALIQHRAKNDTLTLHSQRGNGTIFRLELTKEGQLQTTLVETHDFGQNYTGAANADALARLGVHSAGSLDDVLAEASKLYLR